MWHVYRAINRTKKEIYHGVSEDPKARKEGAHCKGYTKAINHWDCDKDKIRWYKLTSHLTQNKASNVAHNHEVAYKYHKKGVQKH
ncbi:MAG: hypothetical protein FVQ77_06330 [Cytophagales bacterium]|nr:hypothetical protein [Cytophagales bacterium]